MDGFTPSVAFWIVLACFDINETYDRKLIPLQQRS